VEVAFCYPTHMGQPVKLSDDLILKARLTGKTMQRSIAGQVELWARIGQAIEPLLQSQQSKALLDAVPAKPVSECVKIIGTEEGNERLRRYLKTRPFPHYEPAPGLRRMLIRIDADGKRTVGRFVNRVFKPVAVRRK